MKRYISAFLLSLITLLTQGCDKNDADLDTQVNSIEIESVDATQSAITFKVEKNDLTTFKFLILQSDDENNSSITRELLLKEGYNEDGTKNGDSTEEIDSTDDTLPTLPTVGKVTLNEDGTYTVSELETSQLYTVHIVGITTKGHYTPIKTQIFTTINGEPEIVSFTWEQESSGIVELLFELTLNNAFRYKKILKEGENRVTPTAQEWEESPFVDYIPSKGITINELTPETKYCLYVVAYAHDAYSGSEVRSATAETKPEPKPTITSLAKSGETTFSTLSIDVTMENCIGWKYIAQISSEEAPDAADWDAVEATELATTNVTISRLFPDKEYTVYAGAVSESGILGEVEKTNITTQKLPVGVVDNYSDYCDNKLKIGDTEVTIGSFTNVTIVESDEQAQSLFNTTTLNAGGLYILDNTTSFSKIVLNGVFTSNGTLAIVGRYSGAGYSQPEFTFATGKNGTISLTTGALFKNIYLETDNTTLFNVAADNATLVNLQIENCKIRLTDKVGDTSGHNLILDRSRSSSMSRVTFIDSHIDFGTRGGTMFAFNSTKGTLDCVGFTNYTVENCIIEGGVSQSGFRSIYSQSYGVTNNIDITIKNNTVNLPSPNPLLNVKKAKNIVIEGNVFVGELTKNVNICNYSESVTSLVLKSNWAFNSAGNSSKWGLSNKDITENSDNIINTTTPFESSNKDGYYVLKSEVTANGSQGADYIHKYWISQQL